MTRRSPAIGVLLFLYWSTPPPAGADELRLPTTGLGAGQRLGGQEISILPASYSRGEVGGVIAADGFNAHLVLDDNSDTERVHPCGVRFRLPSRLSYRVWVEGGWQISPFSYSATATEDRFEDGVVSLPVVQAGRVVLPPTFGERHQLLWLLSLEPRLDGGELRSGLSKHRVVAEIGLGVLMPSGLAVGALWDPRRRSYVALSRPFTVKAGETVDVPLMHPGRNRHLVIELQRSSIARTSDHDWLDLKATSGDELLPDVSLSTDDRLFGLWYDLEPQAMRLSGASAQDALAPPLVLDSRPKGVEHVAAVLSPRPGLDVDLIRPVLMEEGETTLELRTLPDGEVVARETLGRGVWSHHFARLMPRQLVVELQTRYGNFAERVDLSEGDTGYVLLEPDVILISGTVFRGDQPHPADLTFLAVDQSTVKARTDPEGRYEIATLVALRNVTVALDGIETPPYVDFFLEAISRSQRIDFHLPDVEFKAKVLDAASGEGIPLAEVFVRNEFVPKAGAEHGSRHDKAIAQKSVADEEGVALLPPLRPGTVELRASAPGYFQMHESLIEEVREGGSQRVLEIFLEPIGKQVQVHLKLPNGQPAAGASVLLVDSLVSARALFSAQADENGVARVSKEVRGTVLIRHPDTAFLVRDWLGEETTDEVEWALPRASGRPLSLQVKDPWNEETPRRAWLAIWTDGRRLSGLTLSWLTGVNSATDVNGFWSATNLPEAPVAVLAWPVNRHGGDAGLLNPLATDIAFPWPDLVMLAASE